MSRNCRSKPRLKRAVSLKPITSPPSLRLNYGTFPNKLEVRVRFDGKIVIGDYVLSLEDFLAAAKFVLTGTDLEPNDPRKQFLSQLKGVHEIQNPNHKKNKLRLSA